MKQLTLFTLLLLTLNLFATEDKKPVDEGEKLVHKEESIKGSKDVNNSYQEQHITLSSIKSTLHLKRENISHPPFTALLYKKKSKTFKTLAVTNHQHSFNFKIDKSKLHLHDIIVVINNVDSKKRGMPRGKEVLLEVEITESKPHK